MRIIKEKVGVFGKVRLYGYKGIWIKNRMRYLEVILFTEIKE